MKKIYFTFLLLILLILLISSCIKSESGAPTYIYLPDEAKCQGDTIYVDTLSCIHFSFSVYESTGHIQVSSTSDFSILLFDSECHEYTSTSDIYTCTIELPIEQFQCSTFFCRMRKKTGIYFLVTPDWSDWSPVGYFTLALSQDDK